MTKWGFKENNIPFFPPVGNRFTPHTFSFSPKSTEDNFTLNREQERHTEKAGLPSFISATWQKTLYTGWGGKHRA